MVIGYFIEGISDGVVLYVVGVLIFVVVIVVYEMFGGLCVVVWMDIV